MSVERGARRWPRRLWLSLGIVVVSLAAGTAWLLRDPEPYFAARRSHLESAVVETLSVADGHVTAQVRLRAASGLRVEMLLRHPATVAPTADLSARRPVFLLLGGYERGERAAMLIPDTHGNIVVALSYPYDGNVRVRGLAVIPAIPAIRRALLDTPPAVMIALDYLLSRPDVDSHRVELVGASFGTTFATIAGALDRRVTRVWSVHGAGKPYTLIAHNLRARIPFTPARVVVAGLADLLASGPRLAPERWAPRIAPRPFIMINALDDERMPHAAIMALYASALDPKEIVWLPGAHVQGNRREIIQGLVRAVLERAK